MPSAILDIDIYHLPDKDLILSEYESALILFRSGKQPIGKLWVPIRNHHLSVKELKDYAIQSVDWPFWDHWLRNYICWDEPRLSIDELPPATVAICTRNRPDDLRRCLAGLMSLPDDGQEYLVIDSCSSGDQTFRVVDGFSRVHYIREDYPGLNRARNRALREAKFDIVAFIDDDAVPDPGWLRGLIRNFTSPLILGATGLTMPLELATDAQEWFEKYSPFSRGFFRRTYGRDSIAPIAAVRVGAGANMALRREVVDWVGPFDEALDAGTPTLSGGDTEMFWRILASGYQLIYDPAALNWHRHRRTWKELRQVQYGYGVGTYAIWARRFLFEKDYSVLRAAREWLIKDQLKNLFNALLRRPNHLPIDLILAELWGCFVGPMAYLRSRRITSRRPNIFP